MFLTNIDRDFDAPKPCPYDASAGTIAACGMLYLYQILRPTDPEAAEKYLARAFQLVRDVLRECKTGTATLKDGKVDFGEGEWETILEHSTINGNRYSPRPIMDHGLVCQYSSYFRGEADIYQTPTTTSSSLETLLSSSCLLPTSLLLRDRNNPCMPTNSMPMKLISGRSHRTFHLFFCH